MSICIMERIWKTVHKLLQKLMPIKDITDQVAKELELGWKRMKKPLHQS